MNVLEQYLDERKESAGRVTDAELLVWLNRGVPPEVRLLKFDAWVSRQLAARIDWTWAAAGKDKRIEQCRVYMERLVLELWRRGWLLDGRRLAQHIVTLLDTIGARQRAGAVKEFWPYFRACVDRYVGGNAEELRAEAMQLGAHVGQILSALGAKRGDNEPALPELVAHRAEEVGRAKEAALREKLARQRRQEAAAKADARQPQLL